MQTVTGFGIKKGKKICVEMMKLGIYKLGNLRIYFKCFPVILFILHLQIIGSFFAKVYDTYL